MESPAGIESAIPRAISCPMSGTELVPHELEKLRRDQARVESGFWGKMRRTLARVPFVDELVAAYYCATDPATPLRAKAVLYGALAYFVLPIDIVPDFIFLFGFTDDAAVLYAAIRTVRAYMNESHRLQARAAIDRLANGSRESRSA